MSGAARPFVTPVWRRTPTALQVNETLKVFYNGTPSLANYSDPFYFYTTNAGNGTRAVVLKTPAGALRPSTPPSPPLALPRCCGSAHASHFAWLPHLSRHASATRTLTRGRSRTLMRAHPLG